MIGNSVCLCVCLSVYSILGMKEASNDFLSENILAVDFGKDSNSVFKNFQKLKNELKKTPFCTKKT